MVLKQQERSGWEAILEPHGPICPQCAKQGHRGNSVIQRECPHCRSAINVCIYCGTVFSERRETPNPKPGVKRHSRSEVRSRRK